MPIIDHTSRTDRFLNNAGPVLNQAFGGLMQNALIQQQREDRQREEMNRLNLADRDFAFRQQQADRQQGNVDRAFDQRQGLIDRQIGQEDAAAEFYRGKLMELFPGPVGGMDFNNMDPQTLRGIYDAELYQRQLGESRRGAQVVWEQILGEFGVDHQTPMAAQIQAMLDGADTIEDVEKAKGMAYQMAQQAREQQFESQRRAQAVESTKAMRVDVKQPALMASLSVLDQQFMNRDLDFRQYWGEVGKVIERAQGGGERPTAESIARGRAYDKLGEQFVLEMSDARTDEKRAEVMAKFRAQRQAIDSLYGFGGDQPSPSAVAGAAAGVIPPAKIKEAASVVAKKSDRKQQMQTAYAQAQKIARDSGRDPSDEAVLAEIMRQILPSAGGSPTTGLQDNM